MAQHRHLETLARCDAFRGLDGAEIGRLDTQCVWRRFDAGAEILSHQDESADVYFVAAGTVRVYIASIQGRTTVFRDIDAGGYFGEMAAIDGGGRSASVIARTNATVAKMPAGDVRMRVGDPAPGSRGCGWVEGWRGQVFIALAAIHEREHDKV